jgi:hypothetical protein
MSGFTDYRSGPEASQTQEGRWKRGRRGMFYGSWLEQADVHEGKGWGGYDSIQATQHHQVVRA